MYVFESEMGLKVQKVEKPCSGLVFLSLATSKIISI